MHAQRSMRALCRSDRREGAAAVETALVLPLFFLIVFGVIEFGRAFMVAQLLTNAAREGARSAITAGSTNATVAETVKSLVHEYVGVAKSKVNVAISVNDSTSTTLAQAERRDMCEVLITVPVSDVTFIPLKFLTGITLRGQAAMCHE
ncbi:MAG TPA: TadE/TadG family type IV pilus assembly protein [Caulifigura sp.]|nr:TadE/TadG family type IV pilus assembly protein [Caulifigura sp.]